MLLSFFKKVSDTGCSYTDKHFHEIRTGNRKERNARLSGYCFCKKCLTCSGRAYKDHSLRDSRTYICVFLWCLKKIYHFYQIFLFFLKSCDILEGDFLVIRKHHSGPAFTEIHHLGISTAA